MNSSVFLKTSLKTKHAYNYMKLFVVLKEYERRREREYEKDLGFGGTMPSWLYRREEMLDSILSTYYHIVQN